MDSCSKQIRFLEKWPCPFGKLTWIPFSLRSRLSHEMLFSILSKGPFSLYSSFHHKSNRGKYLALSGPGIAQIPQDWAEKTKTQMLVLLCLLGVACWLVSVSGFFFCATRSWIRDLPRSRAVSRSCLHDKALPGQLVLCAVLIKKNNNNCVFERKWHKEREGAT